MIGNVANAGINILLRAVNSLLNTGRIIASGANGNAAVIIISKAIIRRNNNITVVGYLVRKFGDALLAAGNKTAGVDAEIYRIFFVRHGTCRVINIK